MSGGAGFVAGFVDQLAAVLGVPRAGFQCDALFRQLVELGLAGGDLADCFAVLGCQRGDDPARPCLCGRTGGRVGAVGGFQQPGRLLAHGRIEHLQRGPCRGFRRFRLLEFRPQIAADLDLGVGIARRGERAAQRVHRFRRRGVLFGHRTAAGYFGEFGTGTADRAAMAVRGALFFGGLFPGTAGFTACLPGVRPGASDDFPRAPGLVGPLWNPRDLLGQFTELAGAFLPGACFDAKRGNHFAQPCPAGGERGQFSFRGNDRVLALGQFARCRFGFLGQGGERARRVVLAPGGEFPFQRGIIADGTGQRFELLAAAGMPGEDGLPFGVGGLFVVHRGIGRHQELHARRGTVLAESSRRADRKNRAGQRFASASAVRALGSCAGSLTSTPPSRCGIRASASSRALASIVDR